MVRAGARETPPQRLRVTERDLQEAVVRCAQVLGWSAYHTWLSARSTPGFPDLCMCRAGRLIFAELKAEKGKFTEAQERWLGALGGVPCVEVYTWRPVDWFNGEIERVLR